MKALLAGAVKQYRPCDGIHEKSLICLLSDRWPRYALDGRSPTPLNTPRETDTPATGSEQPSAPVRHGLKTPNDLRRWVEGNTSSRMGAHAPSESHRAPPGQEIDAVGHVDPTEVGRSTLGGKGTGRRPLPGALEALKTGCQTIRRSVESEAGRHLPLLPRPVP